MESVSKMDKGVNKKNSVEAVAIFDVVILLLNDNEFSNLHLFAGMVFNTKQVYPRNDLLYISRYQIPILVTFIGLRVIVLYRFQMVSGKTVDPKCTLRRKVGKYDPLLMNDDTEI